MDANEIKDALSHGYYNGWSPEDAVYNRALPNKPVMGAKFDLIEVKFAEGNFLCVRTPVPVANGPGKKYEAVELTK